MPAYIFILTAFHVFASKHRFNASKISALLPQRPVNPDALHLFCQIASDFFATFLNRDYIKAKAVVFATLLLFYQLCQPTSTISVD